ncbi:MAG: transcription antitermination factor NusB [Clostridia bacterium]|nr:transcription antitermination factor NusB [Clostridia bacterium]
MSRRLAREAVYKLVFEYIFNKEINERTYEMLKADSNLSEPDKEYIDYTYRGIISKYTELCEKIASYADKYSNIDRLVKSDLAAMLVAVYELQYADDIPANVTINEAVDIVKQYSTEKSSGFVNGVLAGINKDLINKA